MHAGALIKEAIEDLEWGALSSSMTLRMQQSPAQIQLSGHDSGDISIQLPVLYGAPFWQSQVCQCMPA